MDDFDEQTKTDDFDEQTKTDDFDEQIKTIRKELHQKYLQYLNLIQQKQQDTNNINNNLEELRKGVEEYIHVELESNKENIQPFYQYLCNSKYPIHTSIPTIKENYYDRYGKKIPKIPRSSKR
ncbi:putative orfan [Tupanvirus soda lake]|uniref:Orfan n=2 Tax=Tupanvirus TaxID=2094720 RepID=A0AC62ACR3_9VIRU|nr:putative orfan [Tupanvirus soda lake]QKU35509.1 putative orfan [Tupanvirus soda lake]